MEALLFFLYLAFCGVIGSIGYDRLLGFWYAFFAALVFTPIVGLAMVFASKRKVDVKFEKDLLENQDRILNSLESIKDSLSRQLIKYEK